MVGELDFREVDSGGSNSKHTNIDVEFPNSKDTPTVEDTTAEAVVGNCEIVGGGKRARPFS